MAAIISFVLTVAYFFVVRDFVYTPLLSIMVACFYFLNKWLLESVFNIISALYSNPRILPEAKSDRIPPGERTVIVQTVLAGTKEETRESLRLLENSFVNNTDKELIAIYLSAALDDSVVEEEINLIKNLQSKYGRDRFYLFHRNNYDGKNRGFKWGGYHDLFRYLHYGQKGIDKPFFLLSERLIGKGLITAEEAAFGMIGDEKALAAGDPAKKIKNAIISDGDNGWPRGSIISIVKKIAHASDKEYAIFQPLISISNADESLYAKMKSWPQFLFNYEAIHNWIKFKRSSFYGKGAIRIAEYLSKIVEPKILPLDTKSHDFIEAMFLKTALMPDITITERTTVNYISDLKKSDRWRIGDLQGIIRYSGKRAPAEARFILKSIEKIIFRELFFSFFVFASIALILFPRRLWLLSPRGEMLLGFIFTSVLVLVIALPKFILPVLAEAKTVGGIGLLGILRKLAQGIADTFLSTLILLQNIIYQPLIIAKNLLKIVSRKKISWTPISVIESKTENFSLMSYLIRLSPSFIAGLFCFYLLRFSFYPKSIYGSIIMVVILSLVFGPVFSWFTSKNRGRHWFLDLVGLLLVAAITVVGVQSERLPKMELDAIKEEIPSFWWDGGWNTVKELEDFKSKHRNKRLLWAEAQFYVAGYYYANKDYERAVKEYRELVKAAPYSQRAPEAQLKIGQCYVLLDMYDEAFKEYKAALVGYPHSRQYLEALLEIGELSYLRAFAPENEKEKRDILNRSLLAYKNAYESCDKIRMSKEEKKALSDKAANGIARTFMSLDMSMSRATLFLKYHFYGKKGRDGKLGTADDLTNPLDKL